MDRRAVVRAALAAGIIAVAGLALATCSNPIDIVGAIQTEVMVANNRFLLVNDVGPAKNATGVSPATSIWIEFDRDLDTSSITPSSVTIKSENAPAVDWTWNYVSATRTLDLYPVVMGGDVPISYTVTVTGILKGSDGSSLQADYAWAFQTRVGPSGSFVINNNNQYTATSTVHLNLTYNSQAKDLRWSTNPADITNSDATGGGTWVNGLSGSPSTTDIPLDPGDGNKTIYVQYWNQLHDAATSAIVPASDSIIYDGTAPSPPAVSVNGGAAFAAASTTVSISASDPTSGVTQMQISNDNSTWTTYTYSGTHAWTLLAGADGARTVYVKVTNGAGLVSTYGSDGVTLDATPPTVSGFTVGAGNPASTTVPAVHLITTWNDGTGSGVTEMQLYQNGVYSSWMTFAADKQWNLDDHAGTGTMWVRVKDAVGNIATSWLSDSIVLYARIVITYTQIYVSNDGDADPKGGVADPGEIAYYLGSNSTYFVTRVYPNTISRNHGTYITAAYLPQGSRTIYLDPTTGTQSLDAWIYDYDGSVSVYQYGTWSVIMTAPFTAGVTNGTISMTSVTGAAGTAYYTWDYQNP